MGNQAKAEVKFYRENKKAPVVEWLDTLPRKAHVKCIDRIDELSELGIELKGKKAKSLKDGIYELRINNMNNHYRILYGFSGKNIIVLTNAFLKKDDKITNREKNVAIRRLGKFIKDPDNHTYVE